MIYIAAPSPTPLCSSYRKGSLQVILDYGRQLYLLILPDGGGSSSSNDNYNNIILFINDRVPIFPLFIE